MPTLPPARDFLLSAGFGGAAALLAALVIAVVAVLLARGAAKRHRAGLEQQERHHREVREEEQRTAAIARCWQRLVWVVDTAGLEPAGETATLGLGPELALEILRGLLRDAEQLGDDTLAGAVTVHLNQFSLVLAQQAGPACRVDRGAGGGTVRVGRPTPASSPEAGGSAASDDASSPTTPAKGSVRLHSPGEHHRLGIGRPEPSAARLWMNLHQPLRRSPPPPRPGEGGARNDHHPSTHRRPGRRAVGGAD